MTPNYEKGDLEVDQDDSLSLSLLISKATNKSLPLFKQLKKGVDFEWTPKCEQALDQLKTVLLKPPILTRQVHGGDVVFVHRNCR